MAVATRYDTITRSSSPRLFPTRNKREEPLRTRRIHGLSAACLVVAMAALALAEPEEKIQLKIVKYDGLCNAIQNLKGQIVVVDVWANWCHPCKAAFPHLVEMHEKYARDGLIAVSVSLDEPPDKEKALQFLRSHGAHFANFLLDVDQDTWQQKFHIHGPPTVFVFDRDGKWTQFKDEKAYPDVEKLVRDLLHSK
jgi:thiol-disulfide isomerase/thioredoxin